MQFRTTFLIPKGKPINFDDNILLCGSCFVENIGEKLEYRCFNALINPFGILFNPVSLAKSLDMIMERSAFEAADTIFHNGLYHSFFHHSRFSLPNQEEHLRALNDASEKARDFLKKSNKLIITLGTAWIYRHKERNLVVSSCHKIPQTDFEKSLLSVDEITAVLSQTFERLLAFNPKIEIILTISPVRHIKDGFVENQQSKSALILAVKALREKFEEIAYFPAYELLMDDLRDYRFYADDLLHPSAAAVSYIWERFCDVYFDDKTLKITEDIDKIRAAAAHRPFHAESGAYRDFCEQNLTKIQALRRRFPNAALGDLERIFEEKM